MERSEWEFIVLKPTPVFLSFLMAQLPDGSTLPDMSILQTDNTVYVLPKQQDDEALLDEIERCFPEMFRHEIRRWLGPDAYNAIEGSFLDFLCCFKFELHSHIVLMEESIQAAKQMLCIRPRSVMLTWMRSTVESDEELSTLLEQVNLSHITENATVVVKNFNHLDEIKPFIEQYYKPIFKAEMLRMSDQADSWPVVDSLEAFHRYFAVEVHTQVVNLH